MTQATEQHAIARAPGGRLRLPARTGRALVVVLLLLVGLMAYAVALGRFEVQEEPVEQSYGANGPAAVVGVYLQPTTVDTNNGWMDVRVSILPPMGNGGIAPAPAKRDMRLLVRHDGRTDELTVREGKPLPEATVRLWLQSGSVRDYPLDRYTSLVRLVAVGADNAMLPIRLTTWEGILGYVVHGSELKGSQPTDLELSLDVQRSGAFAFFALVAYGAMVVMALSAMAIGAIVFIGVRAIEAALVGAVASMVFALFGMRQALPSGPPLGIRADVLVFFWAQLATALAMCLLMIAWGTRGNRPPAGR